MRKGRKGLPKIAVLGVAMLIALGLMGAGYAAWADTLFIPVTAEIGTAAAELDPFNYYCFTEPPEVGGISCKVVSSTVVNDRLEIAITEAVYKVGEVQVHYYCDFNILNTGTIPVKIQDIAISGLPVTGGVEVDPGAALGQQIDPGQSLPFTAHVWLTDTSSEGQDFTVMITFTFVPWNQYVPPGP